MSLLPPVLMISMTGNPISEHYRDLAKPTWEYFGFTVHHFEAITPATMPNYLNFAPIKHGKYKRPFSETEKAVWYSHIEAMRVVRDSRVPTIIVEHDAMLQKRPHPIRYEADLVCFCRNKERRTKLPGAAYYIKPEYAKRVVNKIKSVKQIIFNSDLYLHKMNDHQPAGPQWYHDHAYQHIDKEVGTTIEHPRVTIF